MAAAGAAGFALGAGMSLMPAADRWKRKLMKEMRKW